MRVLVVGGSGYVGRLVLPMLAKHHSIRVFDLLQPEDGRWEFVKGNVTGCRGMRKDTGGYIPSSTGTDRNTSSNTPPKN